MIGALAILAACAGDPTAETGAPATEETGDTGPADTQALNETGDSSPVDTSADSGDSGDSADSAPGASCLLDLDFMEFHVGSTAYIAATVSGAIPLEAEVGYGADADDPDAWVWDPGEVDGDRISGNLQSVSQAPAGDWLATLRWRAEGEWVWCGDGDGGLLVLDVFERQVVDRCHLQSPCEMTGAVGETSEPVDCRIQHAELTTGEGAGEGLTVEIGVGADSSDPEVPGTWGWVAASYTGDADGEVGALSDDAYAGSFVLPDAPGSYDYACRVSLDGALTWTYCDLGGDGCGAGESGSGDGYDPERSGALQVD